MKLTEVMAVEDPTHRAAALYFSHEFRPDDPLAVRLAQSVAVPEAGVWGTNVQARLAEMRKKKPCRMKPAPADLPNIFLTLIDLEDEMAGSQHSNATASV